MAFIFYFIKMCQKSEYTCVNTRQCSPCWVGWTEVSCSSSDWVATKMGGVDYFFLLQDKTNHSLVRGTCNGFNSQTRSIFTLYSHKKKKIKKKMPQLFTVVSHLTGWRLGCRRGERSRYSSILSSAVVPQCLRQTWATKSGSRVGEFSRHGGGQRFRAGNRTNAAKYHTASGGGTERSKRH